MTKRYQKVRQFKINDKVLIIRKRKGTQKTKPFRDVYKAHRKQNHLETFTK